jgi:hypothetical protein
MNDMRDVIQMSMRAAFWCALFVIATSPPDAVAQSRYSGAGVGIVRLSFLSRPESETPTRRTNASLDTGGEQQEF